MPLVACPKCSTNLRVPDGAVPAVRCPKCQTIFQPPKPAQPAFEVVEEEPIVEAKPARPAARAAGSAGHRSRPPVTVTTGSPPSSASTSAQLA